MGDNEQVKPLASATDFQVQPINGCENDDVSSSKKRLRRRKCIRCCACVSASIIILVVVVVILIFTVFRVKDPIIKVNKFTVAKLELDDKNNNTAPKPGSNITINVDVSVKNPNAASFKYSNTTTKLFYHGTVVGEARGPAGQSKARRTARMNVTVDIITDRMLSNPNLSADIGSGLLGISSYSIVPGRVKILNIIKRHVVVKMNCTMTINISSQAIQDQKCKRRVNL